MEVVVYDNVCPPMAAEALAGMGPVDAGVFASGSAVRHYVASGGDRGVPVVAIGPSTAAVASALGLTVAATAQPHTVEGLVAAVIALSGRPSG